MGSANVVLVKSIFAGWERRDFSSVDWADPNIEYAIEDGPAPGSWRGLDGLAEGSRTFLSAWDEVRLEADEYREVDGERVLVPFHGSAHGKTSGLEVQEMWTRGASLFHVRDGKVTRLVFYWDASAPSPTSASPSERLDRKRQRRDT